MHILGLIPARGNSKGIPRKNMVPLLGKPLLSYTAASARGSKKLTRTVLSTDDEEIARVGRECGIDVPFLRPMALATDDTPMMDVVMHALSVLREQERYVPDIIVLLQPTCPLRQSSHIDAAIDLFLSTGADTVVSVMEVPHQFVSSSLMQLTEGRLLFPTDLPPKFQRQSKEKLFARNGPAVLVTRPSVIEKERSLYGPDIRPLFMDREHSVDVDGTADLAYVEFLLKRREEAS